MNNKQQDTDLTSFSVFRNRLHLAKDTIKGFCSIRFGDIKVSFTMESSVGGSPQRHKNIFTIS